MSFRTLNLIIVDALSAIAIFMISATAQGAEISGKVTTPAKGPLVDYLVEATLPIDPISYATKTDGDGKYVLKNLREGLWHLTVKFSGIKLADRKISLVRDQKAQVDFSLAVGGAIFGFVLNAEDGKPLLFAGEVEARWSSKENPFSGKNYVGKANGGIFRIEGVVPGTYLLSPQFLGYLLNGEPQVTVSPKETASGIKIRLERGAVARGKVLNTARQPIADVNVKVASAALHAVQPHLHFSRWTMTNQAGEFAITVESHPERFRYFAIMVNHPGYQGQIVQTALERGKTEYSLDPILLEKALMLQGRVSDPLRRSVEALRVELRRHHKRLNFRGFVPMEKTAYTDVNGYFFFEGLYPTDYSLTVLESQTARYYLKRVNPSIMSQIHIQLEKTQQLRGHVIDTNGIPLEEVNVRAGVQLKEHGVPFNSLARETTNKEGVFSLDILRTEPKHLVLTFSKPGYLSATLRNVEIKNKKLQVVLERGHSINGYLFVPSNIVPPKGNFTVKLFPAGIQMKPTLTAIGEQPRPLISEHFPIFERRFLVQGIPSDRYDLYIVGDGIGATSTTVDLTFGDDEVTLVARPIVELHGRILWADTQQPVVDASVLRSWYPWDLEDIGFSLPLLQQFTVETDRKGEFRFSNLTEGRYILQITYADVSLETPLEQMKEKIIRKEIDVMVSRNAPQPFVFYLGRRDNSFR